MNSAGDAKLEVRVSCRGRDVPRCRFEIADPAPAALPSASTEAGVYSVSPPPGRFYPFDIEAVTPSGRRGRVTVEAPSGLLLIEIPPAARLDGALVDDDGNPVVGARVFGGERTTVTDDSGWFTIDEIRSGEHAGITVQHGGLRTEVRHVFRIDADVTLPRIAFVLPRVAGFDVHVVHAGHGAAISGAVVKFDPSDLPGRPGTLEATSDVEGRCRADGLPPGEYWCRVAHPEMALDAPVLVKLPRTETLILPCIDVPARPLRGTVVDPRGQPLPGRRVHLGHGSTGRRATTDAEGRFAFDSVRSELVTEGAMIPRLSIPQLRVASAGSQIPDTFTLSWDSENRITVGAAVTWRGTLTDEAGRPLTQVQITHRSRDGGRRSDSAQLGGGPGSTRPFEWKLGRGGPGELEFRNGDGRLVVIPVDPGDRRLVDLGTITIPRGGSVSLGAMPELAETDRVSLTLCDPQSFVPVTSTRVRCSNGEWTAADTATPGRWLLIVNVAGRMPCSAGVQEIVAGASSRVHVRPSRPIDLRVHVVREGSVVPGWTVRILPSGMTRAAAEVRNLQFGLMGEIPHRRVDPADALEQITDERGFAGFTRLPEGDATIEVFDPAGRVVARANATLPALRDETVVEVADTR